MTTAKTSIDGQVVGAGRAAVLTYSRAISWHMEKSKQGLDRSPIPCYNNGAGGRIIHFPAALSRHSCTSRTIADPRPADCIVWHGE